VPEPSPPRPAPKPITSESPTKALMFSNKLYLIAVATISFVDLVPLSLLQQEIPLLSSLVEILSPQSELGRHLPS
jgi:hypothetical protein